MTMIQRFFLDTEFEENGTTIMPISLALVGENGREFYTEFEFDLDRAHQNDFVAKNVLPHLKGLPQRTKREARVEILEFLGIPRHPAESKHRIEFWAYYADYDWVLFCQLFGRMVDLPSDFPRFCMDLQQWWTQLGRPEGVKPEKPADEHHALADARWNLAFYKALVRFSLTQELRAHVERPPR